MKAINNHTSITQILGSINYQIMSKADNLLKKAGRQKIAINGSHETVMFPLYV